MRFKSEQIGGFQVFAVTPVNGLMRGLASAHLFRNLHNGDRTWLDLALKNARHAVELDPQLASAHAALGAAELAAGNVARGAEEARADAADRSREGGRSHS